MWRTAASLELLPIGTKTELGEALIKRVKAGDYKESELWCLSRLGARKLFYGPINLVVPPATVTRWVEALLKLPTTGDALAAMARRTEDPTRDLRPPRATPCAPSCRRCRMPTGCSPSSKAKRRTSARSAASSAKNCPPDWCWRNDTRHLEYAAGPLDSAVVRHRLAETVTSHSRALAAAHGSRFRWCAT